MSKNPEKQHKKYQKPTVLISTPVYLPAQGGAATFFSILTEVLRSRVDFIVFTQSLKGEKTVEIQENVTIYRIQPNLINAPAPAKYFVIPPITLFAYLWFRLKHRYIIHAHSTGIFGFTASLISAIFRIDMIKEVMDTADPPYNLKVGKVFRYGSVGYTIEKKLLNVGIPKDKIRAYPSMIPPGDREKFKDVKVRSLGKGKGKRKEKGKDKGKDKGNDKGMEKITKILFVGYWWPSKGIDTLLHAMAIIEKERSDIELTILGDGPERDNIRRIIKDNNLSSIKLVGITPRDEYLTKYLANTDISILPSRSGEGNPYVILEAFQFGRPVIATNVGGTPEFIKNGETGLLIEPEDPKVMADAILKLVNDVELQKKLSKNGKKFLETLPTWEDQCEEIYQDYLRIWGDP
jgi:glycosyltransferase involved in cell wall biosynthesis